MKLYQPILSLFRLILSSFHLPRCNLSVLSMSFVSLERGGLTALCQKALRKYIFSDISKPCTERLPLSEQNPKKEVFQPHLPVRLPCYDLAPVTTFALGRSFRSRTSGARGFHGLTGGVYKARERIHRAMADARLLANPTSWSRVADSSPNWDGFSRSASPRGVASLCGRHCNTCVAPDVRAVLI